MHLSAVITVHKYEPTSAYQEPPEGPSLVKIHVEETFSGDVDGDGVAEFLQVARADGSASFVGIERVDGKVAGREGAFVLQDAGIGGGRRRERRVVRGTGLRHGRAGRASGHGRVPGQGR